MNSAKRSLFLISLLAYELLAQSSFASKTVHPEEADIPKNTVTPKTFTPAIAHSYFRCPRYFTYRGKDFGCDSALRKDAEGLRSFLERSPSAIESLNLYQSNLNQLNQFAYVSSGGLLLMLLSGPLSKQFGQSNQTWIRLGSLVTGGGLVVGSSFLGFSFIRKNESNLSEAIHRYNIDFPEDRIELKFSTSFLDF